MGWNRKIFANLGELSGVVLSAFIGMALVSCAGTDSSVQTKVDDNPNLFKLGTPIADTLASRMPEFAHSVFKGAIDSVPGEYYYYATDGRIDSLVQKEGERYNTVASIAYDSLDGQNNYELKKGNLSYNVNDGKLKTELDFPKYVKTYWGNGNPRAILTGFLYRDNQGVIKVDSGHSETYFESGKINQRNDWKDKQPVTSRQWNENGILTREIDFPKSIKEYWDNGNIKNVMTGLIYIGNQGNFQMDSGRSEIYFESGKMKEQSDWKNKQGVASKQWNENGVLVVELDFPKYLKQYWDNGNRKIVLTGLIYRNDRGNFAMDSGREEVYSEAGKLIEQTDWDNKQPLVCKKWNESGMLTMELDFQKTCVEYWDNGKIKQKAEGSLYRVDGKKDCRVDSGRSELYFENGKIEQQNEWIDKLLVKHKEWNESGVLLKEIDFPKYFKEYWNNGKLKEAETGILYRNDQDVIQVDSGRSEVFYENGKMKEQNNWKDKKIVACKRWNERGILIKENAFPKYVKDFWDNGKPREILTGNLYMNNQGNIALDSGRSEIYYENGKKQQQKDWKNKQIVAYKQWNAKGVLIRDFDSHKYAKEYYDNGKIKKEMTGLYFSSPTNVEVENGFKKEYYENGQIKEHKNYKDKEPYSSKQWNEDGTLSTEWDISAGYYKYYENGTLRLEAKGFKGFTGEKGVLVETGYQTLYFNNGKPQAQEQFKDKKTIGEKIWDENGTLVIEKDVLKGFYKAYFPSGKISQDISGKFHYRDKHIIFEDCSVKSWYENGQPKTHLIYKEKKLISKTLWYPNGNVAFSAELPNHYKVFYDDGKIKAEVTGTIVEENNAFRIKDGVYNMYDVNGKITNSATYKDFQVISDKNNP